MSRYLKRIIKARPGAQVAVIGDDSYDNIDWGGEVPIPVAELLALDSAMATEDAVSAKIAQMEDAYAGAVQQPVSYMGTTFQADTGSQAILTSTLVALNAAGAVPVGFGWWDINNAKVPMTLPELNGLAGAMLAQGWAAFQNKQAKKDAVRAPGATVEQINAVAW